MVNFNPNFGLDRDKHPTMANGTNGVPPIVLCLTQPKPFATACQEDKFERQQPKEKPIMLDPNDKFVKVANRPNQDGQMLGSAIKPSMVEDALKYGKDLYDIYNATQEFKNI